MPQLATDIEGKVEAVQGEGSTIKSGAAALLDPIATAREDYIGSDKTGVGQKITNLGQSLSDAWSGETPSTGLQTLQNYYNPISQGGGGAYEKQFAEDALGLGGASSESPIFQKLMTPRRDYIGGMLGSYGSEGSDAFSSADMFTPRWMGFPGSEHTKSKWWGAHTASPHKWWGRDYYPGQVREHWGTQNKSIGWTPGLKSSQKPRTRHYKFLGIDTGTEKVYPTWKTTNAGSQRNKTLGSGTLGSDWSFSSPDWEWEGLEDNVWK
jgi:hypothetical protein